MPLGRFRSAAASLCGYGVFWLKALRQPTIDLTLRTHAGLITRIVETPGLSLSEGRTRRTGIATARRGRQNAA
jgi:hypothetical protein